MVSSVQQPLQEIDSPEMEHRAASGRPWPMSFNEGACSGPQSFSVAGLVPAPGPLDSQSGFVYCAMCQEVQNRVDGLVHAVGG